MESYSETNFIYEGKIKIYKTNNDVFYNPAQVFNRDLSIIAIKSFLTLRNNNPCKKNSKKLNFMLNNSVKDKDNSNSKDIFEGDSLRLPVTVLEPLGASGLRSIRYMKELSNEIDYLVCGDIDQTVVEKMRKNFELNSISKSSYSCICADARRLLSIANPQLIKQIKLLEENFDFKNSDSIRRFSDDILSSFLIGNINDNHGFTIIDIDPYGTCAPFIDGAIHASEENGLLCFTATDMPVLCGNVPEVTFYRYGGNALKKSYGHEMSLRLLLNTIITTAAKYQKAVIPLLSVSVDFYVRVFVKVKTSAIQCKNISSTTGFVLQCTNCPSFHIINFGDKIVGNKRKNGTNKAGKSKKTCKDNSNEDTKTDSINFEEIGNEVKSDCFNNTGNDNINRTKYKANQFNLNLYENSDDLKCRECQSGKYCIGGPIYTGSLYDDDFLSQLLKTCDEIENCENKKLDGILMLKKVKGLLLAIKDELQNCVLHYHIPSLCNFLGVEMIRPIVFQSALYHLGYKSSYFHRDPLSLKTDAPNKVVLDILRSWALLHPSKSKKNSNFLDVKIETEGIKFDIHSDILIATKKNNVPRWLPNPDSNWGPISKPKK